MYFAITKLRVSANNAYSKSVEKNTKKFKNLFRVNKKMHENYVIDMSNIVVYSNIVVNFKQFFLSVLAFFCLLFACRVASH